MPGLKCHLARGTWRVYFYTCLSVSVTRLPVNLVAVRDRIGRRNEMKVRKHYFSREQRNTSWGSLSRVKITYHHRYPSLITHCCPIGSLGLTFSVSFGSENGTLAPGDSRCSGTRLPITYYHCYSNDQEGALLGLVQHLLCTRHPPETGSGVEFCAPSLGIDACSNFYFCLLHG